MAVFKTHDGDYVRVASRWIKIQTEPVKTLRHSLAEYADHGMVTFFKHRGKKYALGQFARIAYPMFFENEDGKTSFLSGYDCEVWYRPYLIELDDSCEYVRLFEEV